MTLTPSTRAGLDEALAAGIPAAEIQRALEDQLGVRRNTWETWEPQRAEDLALLGEVEEYLSAHAHA